MCLNCRHRIRNINCNLATVTLMMCHKFSISELSAVEAVITATTPLSPFKKVSKE